MTVGNGKVPPAEVTAEEYLGHLAFAYAASPAEGPERSLALALLQLACARLGADPEQVLELSMSTVPGGQFVSPWGPALLAPDPRSRCPACNYPLSELDGRCWRRGCGRPE